MSYKIPYNLLPNLGALQAGDIVPGLRPAFEEGSMTVGDLTNFVNPGLQYRTSMTQVGTSDPTVDYEYENRIGAILWTYVSVGIYNGYLVDAFAGEVPEQTKVFFNLSMNSGTNSYTIIKIDSDNIRMSVKDKAWILSDDLLKTTFIDFIIYPALLP